MFFRHPNLFRRYFFVFLQARIGFQVEDILIIPLFFVLKIFFSKCNSFASPIKIENTYLTVGLSRIVIFDNVETECVYLYFVSSSNIRGRITGNSLWDRPRKEGT